MVSRETLLVTFGGGSQRYRDAAMRLCREANDSGFFSGVNPVFDFDLPNVLPEFSRSHGSFLRNHPRLYGFAVWKPYIILDALRRLPTDGLLMYLDAGCVINAPAAERMSEYFDMAWEYESWATKLEHPAWGHETFLEREWTKNDLLEELSVLQNDRDSPQVQSGLLIFRRTARNEDLLESWSRIAVLDGYRYSDDSPSITENDPAFKEHRHDQSIFSCLYKQAGGYALDDESWHYPDWFKDGSDFPIWAPRWRHGQNMSKYRLGRIWVERARYLREVRTRMGLNGE